MTSHAFPISGHRLALLTTSVLEALVPLGGHWSWQLGAWTRGLCSLSSSVSRAGETVRAPRCSVGLAIRLPPPRSYYAAARVPVPWIPPRPSPHTHTRVRSAVGLVFTYLLTAVRLLLRSTPRSGLAWIRLERTRSLDLQRLVAYVCLRPMAMLRPCTLRHAPSVRPCVRRGCVFKWHRPSYETTWLRRWPPRSSPC